MTGWNLPPGCTDADIDRAFGGDEECFHEDFEIDLEGRAHCNRCDERWWPSAEEVQRFAEANEAYAEHCRQEERRLQRRERWRRFTLIFRWPLFNLLAFVWPRRCLDVLHDDEIPF